MYLIATNSTKHSSGLYELPLTSPLGPYAIVVLNQVL